MVTGRVNFTAMSSATPPVVSSGGDSESLKSLDVAIRERDRVVQELNELRGTLTKRKVNKRWVAVLSDGFPVMVPRTGDAVRMQNLHFVSFFKFVSFISCLSPSLLGYCLNEYNTSLSSLSYTLE